jgi:hypothetical protein
MRKEVPREHRADLGGGLHAVLRAVDLKEKTAPEKSARML